MRTLAVKNALLAVTMLLSGAVAVTNCSSQRKAPTSVERAAVGSVGLELQLANGATVTSVHYVISGNGITALAGDINVSAPNTSVSLAVSGLPASAADAYTVTLTGTSTDGRVSCNGTAKFGITANVTTSVNLVLECSAPSNTGTVTINGTVTFNGCPVVTTLVAAPAVAPVGGTIDLSAVASDPDGDALAYAWTTASGTFATPSALATKYTCTTAGAQLLTFTVTAGGCATPATIPVTCGSGGSSAAGGSGGSSAAGGSGGGSGGSLGSSTGGSGGVGGSTGGVGGSTGGGLSMTCPQCLQAHISTGDCDPPAAGCATITTGASDVALCEAALSCMTTKGTADGTPCWASGRAGDCLCGTAAGTACALGEANGLCKTEIRAAALVTDPNDSKSPGTRFFNQAFPIAPAAFRVQCEADFCAAECGGSATGGTGGSTGGTGGSATGGTGGTSEPAPVCGNGFVESGEQCDPPGVLALPGRYCSPACRVITCGPGGGAGGAGDSSATGGAGGTPAICGNGIVESGEQCEPPSSLHIPGACSSTCQILTCATAGTGGSGTGGTSGTAPVCGNGFVESGEQCDPPGSARGAPIEYCNAACQIITSGTGGSTSGTGDGLSVACTQCLQNRLDRGDCDPPAAGCSAITTGASDVALCEAAFSCMLTKSTAAGTRCWAANGGASACLCGDDLFGTACGTALAQGICKPEIRAAALVTDPNEDRFQFARLFSVAYPIGYASFRVQCAADFCQTECE